MERVTFVKPDDVLATLFHGQGIVLDVRTDLEHDGKKLSMPHAHVPLDRLLPHDFLLRHGLGLDSPIYVLCRSGGRAQQAAQKFQDIGCRAVYVIEGGILACEVLGISLTGFETIERVPASVGSCTVSLERQVRIFVGLSLIVGCTFAILFHQSFVWVPLGFGVGLLFAGLTDRCGAALMLTKAPWNRSNLSRSGQCTSKQAGGGCR